jgi:S-(hydroxymethyl)glutathione dehydrogenase/alcohol dehydrogenase
MRTEAAILVETGKPLVLAELEIPILKPGQVLVEISYSGICHTQVLECRGYRGEDKFLPHCLGHEGSGIVRETGPDVKKVKASDKVILSWIKGSGMDIPGTVYDWQGKKVNSGSITTFGRYSIISENRLTLITEPIEMDEAALIGCAIPTGAGAVFNVANPKTGQSLAVFGVGGVGLCAICAAKIAQCGPIIAVDINESKLQTAREMGATHLVNAAKTDPIQEIQQLSPSGLDYAVECSGKTTVMNQAINSIRNQGGAVVIIGNARFGEKLEIDPKQFNLGKKLLGTWGGDSVPDRDYPRYQQLIRSKELNVKPLLTKVFKLAEINEAINQLELGQVIRPLVRMN